MYNYVLTESEGITVYINLINSPAGYGISRQPQLINLIKEIVPTINLKSDKLIVEKDMGRLIGNTDIIETSEKDNIYYALPNKKKVFSRFAKNRYPKPSRKITLVLKKDDDKNYEVYDAWIGPNRPAFPGSDDESNKSRSYWDNHALVEDAQKIQSKTITKDCPY